MSFVLFLQLLGILLIYIGKLSTGVTSLPIIGGIVACGIILILISILGLIGAVKHHQVILFFYMIILFILFIIQFSIACSCLAVNSDKVRFWNYMMNFRNKFNVIFLQQKHLAEEAWVTVNDPIKAQVQEKYNCCGFNSTSYEHPSCLKLQCCIGDEANNCSVNCRPCLPVLTQTIDDSFRLAGTIGLFFSFTEVSSFNLQTIC